MKNSILYMIFEALSKGGNQLILLYVAYTLNTDIYITFLLLVSLETLLPIFVLSNYNEVLYTLSGKYKQTQVFSSLSTITMSTVLVFVLAITLFHSYLYEYFDYYHPYVYTAIAANVFFVVYFKFLSMYHQLEEDHTLAIYLKSLPFFFSFLSAFIGVTFFDDKVAGFFIGKMVGFFIAFSYLLLKKKILTPRFSINRAFITQYLSRSKFLLLITLFGWLSTYGFINIGKLVSTTDNVVSYGYLISLYMLFLLIANGINQVYAPRIKKLYEENVDKARKLSMITLLLYFSIGILAYVIFLIIEYFQTFLDAKAVDILSVFPYAVTVFLIASFKYISDVYIYVSDSYKHFSISLLIIESLSLMFAIYLLSINSVTLIYAYLLVILARSGYTFIYAAKILQNRKKNDQC